MTKITKLLCRLLVSTCAIAGLVLTSTALAQPSISNTTERLYGQGVHAYFAGHLDQAMVHFNQAASMGSQDPRVFYFRGLTHTSLGDGAAAKSDFDLGATYEANSTLRYYPVNQSLQRVQGYVRMQIEESRNQAEYAYSRTAGTQVQIQNRIIVNRPGTAQAAAPGLVFDSSPRVQNPPPQINFPDVSGVEEPTSLLTGKGEVVIVPDVHVEPTPAAAPAQSTIPAATTPAPPTPDPFGGDEVPKDDDDIDPFGDDEDTKDDDDIDPFGDDEDSDDDEDPIGNR